MSGSSSTVLVWFADIVVIVVMAALEVYIARLLDRRPASRLAGLFFADLAVPKRTGWRAATPWALLFVALQPFPLSQERLFGGTEPPDHILGGGLMLAELLFGLWLWRNTRSA